MSPFRTSTCRKDPVGRPQTVPLPWPRIVGTGAAGWRAARPLMASVGMLLGAVVVCGCQSLSPDSESGMFSASPLLDISRIRGPLERTFPGDESPLELGKKYSPEAKRQVDLAQAKFDSGDHKAAAKMFKAAAKKYKDSSIGEEAQYRLAECWYALGEYPRAQDAFDQLFADYPSTRYVEPATRRLFAIARHWLEITEPVAKTEIRQVSGEPAENEPGEQPEEQPAGSRDPTIRLRILPNFHDSSRPIFDTQGRALQSLKTIWLNDPTGPLADDALMLTATYYQRRENFVESDRYFKILREEYPNSPHFEKAFVLGSHVKLMSYQGAYYEGRDLETAQKLKEQTLHLFPNSPDRQQVRQDLQRVYLLQAERAWSNVEYYQKKGRPRAIAIACMTVIREFPDTQFAGDARRILQTIDRKELQGLPDVADFLNSLPADEPEPETDTEPSEESVSPPRRVKSVSDSRAEPKPSAPRQL